MPQRFILRKEEFGGIIIDRDTGLELMLNSAAFLIACLSIEKKLEKRGIISFIHENYSIQSNINLSSQIEAILDDIRCYFNSENGKIAKWNSNYCPSENLEILSSPISVFWEITSACNLRCLHCYNSSGRKSRYELTTSECYALVKELAEIGVCNLIIGGGEPFFRSDFLDIIKFANDLGFNIVIATNGTLLSLLTCSRLSKLSRLRLYLSINDFRPEKYEHFCGIKGAFHKLCQSIEQLNTFGIEFGVQTMLTSENKNELSKFLEFVLSINAKSWHLKAGVNIGRELANKACLADDEAFLLKRHIEQLAERASDQIPIHFELPLQITINKSYVASNAKSKKLSCGPGFRNCGILPNGHLVPCSFLRGKEWISEHSVREIGFKQLWVESKIFEPFRTLTSDQLVFCNTCSLLGKGCNAGCRARAYNECGSFYNRDPRCRLTL